jgi:microcystin-dependent protein
MVDFLNDDITIEGAVTTKGSFVADGGLTVGVEGFSAGEVGDSWRAHVRVQVADVAERDDVVAWRTANAPISALNPLLVWRADGSLTGVNEITMDGVNWYAESPVAGDLEMTMAAAAPYGWLLCQGQLLASAATNYPALWAAASPAYRVGGDLRLPDLRGRLPMGAGQGAGLTLRNIGDVTGTETVALTESQLASHAHSGTTNDPDRSLNHNHTIKMGQEDGQALSGNENQYELHDPSGGFTHETSNVAETSAPTAGTSLKHKHTFTTGTTGAGEGHPNIPPSAIVNFKVKV